MTFDIGDTLAPKSDQLDAIELIGAPQTFTITDVTKGKDDQPVNVHLAEFPRVWRPGKSMRRVLAACWGTDASQWVGRRVTLYCDETVTFGNDVTGGTRISHLSHIDGRKKIPLLVKRGKSATFTVDPLPDAAPLSRREELKAEWRTASPDRRAEIEAEVNTLDAEAGVVSPRDQLVTLLAMPRLPEPVDRRSAEEIANDMRLEQLAEARELARTEPTSDQDAAWLARRNEAAWEPRT